MTRITDLKMTAIDVIGVLSEGNPGAMVACIGMLRNGADIDPDSMMGGLGSLLSLDTNGIYGSHIHILYKYVCAGSLVNTIGLLRAVQMGFAPESELKQAISREYLAHDAESGAARLKELIDAVQERLPRFGQAQVAEALS